MGARGPAKRPAALRMMDGNPGKQAVNKAAPVATGALECPSHLGAYGQEVWARLIASMPPHLYGAADTELLAAYCDAVEMRRAASMKIRGGGELLDPSPGQEVEAPSKWFAVVTQQATLIAALGSKLGLDPAARSSINLPPAPDQASKFGNLMAISGGRKP